VTAREYDLDKVTLGLGDTFALSANAYKPYACGLVVHPTIDGCSQIRERDRPDPMRIESIELKVAPLVLDLCNKRDLRRALESKYSIYHAAAIGLARGKGGLQEFTDAAVADPVLAHLRDRVRATADGGVTEDQVDIAVRMVDGSTHRIFVEQSLGNVHRPLSNAQLEEKFRDQAVLALPAPQVESLIADCWRIDSIDDAGAIARGTRPQ
jgi:2-methylcitrate dehydratase PrpD